MKATEDGLQCLSPYSRLVPAAWLHVANQKCPFCLTVLQSHLFVHVLVRHRHPSCQWAVLYTFAVPVCIQCYFFVCLGVPSASLSRLFWFAYLQLFRIFISLCYSNLFFFSRSLLAAYDFVVSCLSNCIDVIFVTSPECSLSLLGQGILLFGIGLS